MIFKFKQKYLLLIISTILTFSSCIDLNTEPRYFADAFIVSRIVEGDTLFAIDAQAQSNMPISKVSLRSDNSESTIELKSITPDSTIFEHITPITNYFKQLPKAGSYIFDFVLQNGTQNSDYEVIKSKWIKPFHISSISFNSNDMSETFDWPEVTDANYYYAQLVRNDTIVFKSGLINKEFSSVKVYPNSNGWMGSYVAKTGDSLTVFIMAILAEDSNSGYLEIQSISYSDSVDFAWGD
jgi:hypothetical protein